MEVFPIGNWNHSVDDFVPRRGPAISSYLSKDERQERALNVAWCLDQGGRRVEIDNIMDCFQLIEVPLESETWEEQRRECTRVPTQTYIKAPGNPTLYFCYEFKRVNREN